MREILFRGKRLDNGEWVEGYLYEHEPPLVGIVSEKDEPEASKWFIARTGFADWNMPRPVELVEVDPSTVGQYTGLNDKNGKRIFEGDVVSIEDGEFWVFSFGNCGGVQNVAHEVGYTGFHLSPLSQSAIHNRDYGQRDDPVYYLNAIGLCVIGNIHDNPERLKEGADNS